MKERLRREDLPREHAEGVDVGARVGRGAVADALGREALRGVHEHREVRRVGARTRPEEAVDGEVDEHARELSVATHEHHVVGADVTVREARGVDLVEPLAERLEHELRLVDVHGARAPEPRREELPVDGVIREVGAPVGEQARGGHALHGRVVDGLERPLREEETVKPAAIAEPPLAEHLEGHLVVVGADGGVDGADALVVRALGDAVALDDRARGHVVGVATLEHGAEPRFGAAVLQGDGVGQRLLQVIAVRALHEGAGVGRLGGPGGDVVGREAQELSRDAVHLVEVEELLEFLTKDLCGGGGGGHCVREPR